QSSLHLSINETTSCHKFEVKCIFPVIVQGWQNICSNKSKIWAKLFETRIVQFLEALKKENNLKNQPTSSITIDLT
ncbi:6930_t:CDS:1, partial [Cetraspora pellucida]